MLPKDDLFACGYSEPHASTLCSVVGIDDLIILGIVVAASVAASQISANENESTQNDLLDAQQKEQMKQTQLGYLSKRGNEAAQGIASRHGGHGQHAQTEAMEPWAQQSAIQNHYDLGRQANARQADATRTQGWINAGSTLAGGIASQALRPAAGAAVSGAGGLANSFDATGEGIASRAGSYDLPTPGGVQTAPLQPTDPSGGFQLQSSDYQLLGGAQPYSQSPFGDDPYATANPYQNPNRYRFGL